MGKIFCLMGKSACGKDSLYKRILAENPSLFRTLVPYTTRPIREGETNGIEYYFVTESEKEDLRKKGKIIELRSYHTIHGVWHYFTADDQQIRLSDSSYLVIGTLESYRKLQAHFGSSALVPLYIEVESGERLQRALNRERAQSSPKYAELCRRFLADEEDFSAENLEKAGVVRHFCNDDLDRCLTDILSYIKERL